MKDPIMLRHRAPLSPDMARYWKDLLYRVTKVGTEIEVAPPKRVRREDFEAAIRDALHPSHDFACLGSHGVLDVVTEHCGIEIQVIGRHPYFRMLQAQYGSIMGLLQDLGARPRATCGLHFHLLTPGLGEPVPEVILANLWNLVRRYAPELKFITSGGERLEALCRRRNYNSHLELVQHSPVMTTMEEIYRTLKHSRTVPEHQNFLNLEHLRFNRYGDVLPFHLEFRFPDADLSPTSVSAKTFLFMALLLKAVDLSQYGVIHVGKIQPWRRKVELLNILSNNDGTLAASDTSGVTHAIMEELRQGLYELLDLLTPTFNYFVDNPSSPVLMALVDQPISLRRCAGYSWADIETSLSDRTRLDEVGFDDTDRDMMQHIELGDWPQFPSFEAWCWYAARELYLTPQNLERRLQHLDTLRGVRWDPSQGSLVFTT
jgi:hypothetical protein